jgi:erythronate-4-phosphate dehydrogenase
MISVFADQYLYQIDDFLPDQIELQLYDPADGLPEGLSEAHALLIRTVNPINKKSLPSIPDKLSFIGTGSSGTDHVDQDYLQENNISFADAAGCNARSVAEYIATCLLIWSNNTGHPLHEFSVGIIGMGHVGRQVKDILHKLEITTVEYDPPRAEREAEFSSVELNTVLEADILSFHTPLNHTGNYPTFHWLDSEKLKGRTFDLIINTARGGVVDEEALIEAHKKGAVRHFILDVWENEPQLKLESARQSYIKTPHIAGYSVQAKRNASRFIADELIRHFDLAPAKNVDAPSPRTITEPVNSYSNIGELITQAHPIRQYEEKLHHILQRNPDKRGKLFNKLRAEFPLRQEFNNIKLPKAYFNRYPVLQKLDFRSL